MVTFHELATGREEVLYDINSGEAYDENSDGLVKSLRDSLSEWSSTASTELGGHS